MHPPHSKRVAGARSPRRHFNVVCAGAVAALGCCVPARAQLTQDFLSQTSPRPPFSTPDPAKYNLKLGKLKARLFAGVQLEANDNINLVEHGAESDISIGPYARIGFVYPMDERGVLQFNIGAGYRWYLKHSDLNTFMIAPDTRIEHTVTIGKVNLTAYDNFSIQNDPTTRPDLGGTNALGPNGLLNFTRLINSCGILANWQPFEDYTFNAGYDYAIDRSLSGQYQNLDKDDHTFTAGVNYAPTTRWRVGVTAAYTITDYLENVQNDGTRFSIGPTAFYQLSQFITLNAAVAFTSSSFDQTGTIGDTSSFTGVTYSGSVNHTINKHTAHSLQVSKTASGGVGSNFTESLMVQYAINTRFASAFSLNVTLAYDHYSTSSAAGESGNRFLGFIGTTVDLTRHWTAGIGFAAAMKDSDLPGRDYFQNRLTLDLARHF